MNIKLKIITPNNIIFSLYWFLCFSIALPHTILPGKAGFISILLFIFWLIEGDLKSKIQILYKSKLFLIIFVFIILWSASMLWTEYTDEGLKRLSVFKYYIFILPVLITSISKQRASKLIHAFILGNILHATLIILFSHNFINLPNEITLYSPYLIYGPFFAFSSFYCLYNFRNNLDNKNILRGFIYLSCSLLFIYIIFTNKGRSGQLAFIFSTFVTLALLHTTWKKTAIYMAIALISLITVSMTSKTFKSIYLSAMNDIENVVKGGEYYGSWGTRWGLLVTNIEVIKKNPVLGVGIGDSQEAIQRIIARGKNNALYPLTFYNSSHNYYITTLVSIGIIGFIVYILIHVLIFKLPLNNTKMKHLSLIFLTILITNGISDDIILHKPYNIYFAIIVSLFINLSLKNKDKYIGSNKIL